MWQAVVLCLWGVSSLPHSVAEATASCRDESDVGDFIQISREKDAQADVKYEAPDMSLWESEAAHELERLAFVDISFTCTTSNLKLLEEEVLKRSDPKSPLYGKWLSKEGVKKFCPPTGAAKVVQWLVSKGLEEAKHFFQLEEGSRIRLQNLTVQQVEALFVTEVRKFTKDGLSILRALDLHLPAEVDEAISAIYGLHGSPLDAKPRQNPPSLVQSRKPAKASRNSLPSQQLQQRAAANSRALDFFEQNQVLAGQAHTLEPYIEAPPQYFAAMGKVPKSETRVPPGLNKAKSRVETPETGDPDPDVAPLPRQVTHAVFESAGPGGGYSSEAAKRSLKLSGLPESPIEVLRMPPTKNLNNECNEANTDIQVLLATAPGVPLKIYSYTDPSWPALHQFKDWYLKMLAEEEPPLAASNSFGANHLSPTEGSSAQRQLADLNHDMLCLAARGISMFVASGDGGSDYGTVQTLPLQWKESQSIQGAYNTSLTFQAVESCALFCSNLNTGNPGGSCRCGAFSFDNETGSCHSFCLGTPYSIVPKNQKNHVIGGPDIIDEYQSVDFPGASPWVTAVGAITEEDGRQIAVRRFGSGGGFANFGISGFETPQWQQAAVQSFLKKSANSTIKPSPRGFNPQGRALPDVSAFGEAVHIYYIGPNNETMVTSMMGTSVAAPLFTALVSRLNLLRSEKSLPPMGFINPWLYSYPHMLTDITVGANNIPRTFGPGPSTKYGFPTTEGWDAVTGLGAPKFPAMSFCAFAMFPGPRKEEFAELCLKT